LPVGSGLLVPPGDASALGVALDRLVADPALREQLAAGARAKAADFSWPVIAARLVAVYEAAIAAQRQGSTRLQGARP
jgi:2-deoxystreptamine N-acetyl-D-glucosaminyltransferase/2-deoxystreptamine glucosyltransferase